MSTPASVAAVVVTYNRKDKVTKVLDHVLSQTRKPDWVLVVDNASTDGTPEVLARYTEHEHVRLLRLEENTGGAGGFAHGMSKAYELGADFVWIMDDDCYPNDDALEELVNGHAKAEEAMGMQLPYACSVVKWTDGDICEMNNPGTTWDWGRLLAKGVDGVLTTSCSFVSVLVPRWAMTRFGLPLKEYFIWFDDAEYTLRLGKAAPGVQCLRSVVVHDLGVNRGVNFGDINHSNIWKFEYGARNEASYRLHHEDFGAFLRHVQRTLRGMREGRVSWPLRLRVLKALARGIRFNPKPEFPRSVL
ncbi:glycosyltransferase family 2 protein [Streptoalloteichus hindustanus]|uniref:Glycosyltransferase, GT2 family n=1 Tax=Streptoalloteichus hindustanus TaxID=2017 RepID=A0A1M4VIN5_STRHI|nr:glycosyltransferase family 2 protein [Streptoalloteichus hindustanus]SHE68770.1 Glycosyltransferase, GT2 family [Streptoalloteichus hindustanus]